MGPNQNRRDRRVTAITIFGVPLLVTLGDALFTGRESLPISPWIQHELGFSVFLVIMMAAWALYAYGYASARARQAAEAYEDRMRERGRKVWPARQPHTPSTALQQHGALTDGEKAMVLIMLIAFLANGVVMTLNARELIYHRGVPSLMLWFLATTLGLFLSVVEIGIGYAERGTHGWRAYVTSALMMLAEIGLIAARIYAISTDSAGDGIGRTIAVNALSIAIAAVGPWANRWLGARLPIWIGDVGHGFLPALLRMLRTVVLAVVCAVLFAIGWIVNVMERILTLAAWCYFSLERIVWILFGGDHDDDDRPRTIPPPPDDPPPGTGNGHRTVREYLPPTTLPTLVLLVAASMTTGCSGCACATGATPATPVQGIGDYAATEPKQPPCARELLDAAFEHLEPILVTDDRGDLWWFCGVDLSGTNDRYALTQLDACVAKAKTINPAVGVWIAFVTGDSDATRTNDGPMLNPVRVVTWATPPLPCEPNCTEDSLRVAQCVRGLRTWLESETVRRNALAQTAAADAHAQRLARLHAWHTAIRTEIAELYTHPYDRRDWITDGSSYAGFYAKVNARIAYLATQRPVASVTVDVLGDLWEQIRNTDDQRIVAWAKQSDCGSAPALPFRFPKDLVTVYLIQTRIWSNANAWGRAWRMLLSCARATLPGEQPFTYFDGMRLPGPEQPMATRIARQE